MLSKISFVLISLLIFSSHVYAQALECTEGQSTSASQILAATAAKCCGKKTKKAQKKCINAGIKALKKTKTIISNEVNTSAKSLLKSLIANSCDAAGIEATCTADVSTTTDEALNNVSGSACDLEYNDQRKKKLKALRRAIVRAKGNVGTTYAHTIRDGITALLKARNCGAGGKKRSNGCKSVRNPRDGAIVGNVYKLSDIPPHRPVFITHNGARSGTAITKNGTRLDKLSYTGLGNRDVSGLRHHYRFHVSCRSLPSGFLIKLGSTCYEINTPCGRID